MKIVCLLAAAAAALALAATSQARTTPHHRWSSMTLTERRAVVAREIRRQRIPVRRWLRTRRLAADANVYHFCAAIGVNAPGPVCVHGQKLVHAIKVERNLDLRIAALAAARAAPTHLVGWLCIHNGRHPGAPGDPHEGRGYNGAYSGVLQMSAGWGGYPVSDWNTVPDLVVYRDAEAVAAQHGFAASWMIGQWPSTYPPCADLF